MKIPIRIGQEESNTPVEEEYCRDGLIMKERFQDSKINTLTKTPSRRKYQQKKR